MYEGQAANLLTAEKAVETPIRNALEQLQGALKRAHNLASNLDGILSPVLREPGPPAATEARIQEVKRGPQSSVHASILDAVDSVESLSRSLAYMMDRSTI